MSATIEEAIQQLEESSTKLRTLSIEEERAIKDAVREATREATASVKADYKDKKAEARQEARDAEKSIREAQNRISKALGAELNSTAPATRAKKGERDAQFLDYVRANPDTKLADIARGIGIQASAANGLAKRLVEQGKVVKSDSKTYKLA